MNAHQNIEPGRRVGTINEAAACSAFPGALPTRRQSAGKYRPYGLGVVCSCPWRRSNECLVARRLASEAGLSVVRGDFAVKTAQLPSALVRSVSVKCRGQPT
jgi:hypothetical protein